MAWAIGIIGVGSMGGSIARRLLELGHRVSVWDMSPERLEKAASVGAGKATSARDLAARNDVIILSLPSPDSVRSLLVGEGGVTPSLRAGSIVIDMSTVDPATSMAVYHELRRHDVWYLDAPVSGGPRRAAEGRLTITVGGDQEAFRKVEPLLRQMGEHVFYLGGSGSGSTMKLINQLLVFAHTYAAVEAFTLAKALNIEPAKMYEVVKVGSGNSWMFEEMLKLILGGQIWGGRTELLIKDINLTYKMSSDAGVRLGLCRFLRETAERMAAEGYGDDDAAHDFVRFVERMSRVDTSRNLC